jgi:hypothetical protein
MNLSLFRRHARLFAFRFARFASRGFRVFLGTLGWRSRIVCVSGGGSFVAVSRTMTARCRSVLDRRDPPGYAVRLYEQTRGAGVGSSSSATPNNFVVYNGTPRLHRVPSASRENSLLPWQSVSYKPTSGPCQLNPTFVRKWRIIRPERAKSVNAARQGRSEFPPTRLWSDEHGRQVGPDHSPLGDQAII